MTLSGINPSGQVPSGEPYAAGFMGQMPFLSPGPAVFRGTGFSRDTAKFAMEFAICRRICCLPLKKNAELLHLYQIQGFLVSFLILPFIKQ